MSAARAAIGDYCCRSSIDQIFKKCGWLTAEKMMMQSATSLIHKYITIKIPSSMADKFYNLKTKRRAVKAEHEYKPKTANFKKFYVYLAHKYYYTLPQHFHTLPPKKFKNALKIHLMTHSIKDTMD